MNEPRRIAIHGATGRMGQALLRLAGTDPALDVVAAISRQPPVSRVTAGVPFFASAEMEGLPEFDVLVDFSLPEGFAAALQLARQRRCAFVSGTTGLGEAQMAALQQAAEAIPVLWASNFSLGIALLHELVRRAAAALPGWDCDIIEMHHVRKQDAPSGTALTLGEAAAGAGATPHYAAIRAGDIVGEHCVQFTGPAERIELVHRANDRDIFARGALQAAVWLAHQAPGQHTLADMLRVRRTHG